MKSTQPIGIFDSGIGGLTVAQAVKNHLPHEQLIYFGDIAHLPYGDKSAAAIQAYSVRISQMLLAKKCKVILIACNSASSAAYDLVREYVGRQCQVFDVINPTVDFIRENHQEEKVGLIGTKQTVTSDVYGTKIKSINKEIYFRSLATPLLVPMIEEGIVENAIAKGIVANYLSHELLQDISALILGCTHYPVIKKEIAMFYEEQGKNIQIID
ncbi:MAG: glutamate racemase, partial [Bacteroidota bacterium]